MALACSARLLLVLHSHPLFLTMCSAPLFFWTKRLWGFHQLPTRGMSYC